MQQFLRLGINNPCAANWDQMTPDTQGRFCGSCQKTVVDFTAMDDRELLQWFSRHQGPVCGRLLQDQLDRPITGPSEKKPRPWHFLITALLFTAEAAAQTKPPTPLTTQTVPQIKQTIGDTTSSIPIRGRLIDKSGQPVIFATVKYSATHGVITDSQGYFSIPTDEGPIPKSLDISALGYEPAHINVAQLLAGEKHEIVMTLIERSLGEVVVVAGVVSRHKRSPVRDTLAILKDTLAAIGLAKPAITAYPNPVARGGEITLKTRLDQQEKCSVQLLTATGVLIAAKEVYRPKDNIALPIPASLVPGTYFIRLSNPATGKCYSQEIVVY